MEKSVPKMYSINFDLFAKLSNPVPKFFCMNLKTYSYVGRRNVSPPIMEPVNDAEDDIDASQACLVELLLASYYYIMARGSINY